MHALRRFISGRTFGLLALAATLALNVGCPADDTDGDGGGGGGPDPIGGGGGGAMSVSGRVTYDFVPAIYSPTTQSGTLAFNQATEKPVRNGLVQARQGSTVLATTYTDEQGNYSLSFTAGSTGSVTIAALAKTKTPEIQVEDNTDSDAIWGIGETVTSSTTTKNLHATHGWTGSGYDANKRSAAPFAILDTIYTAAKAFMAVRPAVNFPALKVNWSPDNVPQSGTKTTGQIGTSHYAFSDKEIYVLGKSGVDTDEFDTHVIAHEWGHYFEDNLSRSDSPGGSHSAGDILDPRIAFGEGYGNAIASMLLPESIYADTAWAQGSTLPGAFGFDAETEPSPTDDPNPGPFSEMSVMRVLYDLYDSGSTETTYDNVGVGLGTIYDVLVGPEKTTDGMTTIASFITGLKAQPGVNATAVNTLLAHYGIGAITSAYGDGDTKLRAMYTNVNSYPYSQSISLTGAKDSANKRAQNQYFVFTGTGAQMTINATSASDVGIAAYQKGVLKAQADDYYNGTESFSFVTQPDVKYVLVVTGFEEQPMTYPATVSLTSQ